LLGNGLVDGSQKAVSIRKLPGLHRIAAICACLPLLAGSAWAQAGDSAETQWRALNQTAVAADKAGDYRAAEIAAQKALEFARAAYGERHPSTITSLNNLAFIYDRQGRYAEAEPLFAQALALAREVLGERHPDTISSLSNLASVYDAQGRYAEAEPLYAQALQLRREVLGERHPDTISLALRAKNCGVEPVTTCSR
jgi:tetratricopeptide (TPR) repeat protein